MASQLSLAVEFPEPSFDELKVDMADAVLEAYGGDAKVAIRELLLDADFLRDQLYTASQVISAGYTRGWKPKYERDIQSNRYVYVKIRGKEKAFSFNESADANPIWSAMYAFNQGKLNADLTFEVSRVRKIGNELIASACP